MHAKGHYYITNLHTVYYLDKKHLHTIYNIGKPHYAFLKPHLQ